MRNRKLLTSAVSLIALVAAHAVSAGPVTDADIANDGMKNESVLSFGVGTQGHRFSSLDKVNPDTIANLRPVWAFSFGGEKMRGQEAQALVHDGVIYVTGSYSRVFAVDAHTGIKKWQYEAHLPDGIMPCCDVVNRGAALYDNLVIFGTLDAKLVALD